MNDVRLSLRDGHRWSREFANTVSAHRGRVATAAVSPARRINFIAARRWLTLCGGPPPPPPAFWGGVLPWWPLFLLALASAFCAPSAALERCTCGVRSLVYAFRGGASLAPLPAWFCGHGLASACLAAVSVLALASCWGTVVLREGGACCLSGSES